MYGIENIRSDDLVEVALHVVKKKVYVLGIVGPDDLLERDNIRVWELFEEGYFPVGPLGVSRILKCVKTLLKSITTFFKAKTSPVFVSLTFHTIP